MNQKHERTKQMMQEANLELMEKFMKDENIIAKYPFYSIVL